MGRSRAHRRWRWSLGASAVGLAGCVVAVDEKVSIHEPVDLVVIDVAAGDVTVVGEPGPVVLEGSFGGAGQDAPQHTLSGTTLTVSSGCALCAGDLIVHAPPETAVSITLGAGDLEIEGMTGSVDAAVSGGSAKVRDHGAGPVVLDADVGDVSARFHSPPDLVDVRVTTGFVEIEVPPGAYAFDLRAPAGSVSIQGLQEDPSSPHEIVAQTGAGSISVRAR